MAFTPYKFFALCAIFILICGFTATKTENIENLESECRPYVEKALKDQLQKGDPALQPSDSTESAENGQDNAETATVSETDDKSQEDGQSEEKAASSENVSGGDDVQVETDGSDEVEEESKNLETASETDVSTEKSSDINLIQPEDEIASESEEQSTDAQQSTEINEDDVQADQAPEPESTEEQNVEDKTVEEGQSVEMKNDGEIEQAESAEASKEVTEDAVSAESTQQETESSEAAEGIEESAEQKDKSAEQQESAEQKEESVEQKEESAEEKVESAEQKDDSAEQKEESAEQKEESGEQKDESAEQRDESAEQKDESAEQKEESAEQREESAEQKEESTEQKEESAEQKDESAEQKDESTEQKDASAEQKDESAEQQDESVEQKSVEKSDSVQAVESAEKSVDSKETEGSLEETKEGESTEKPSDDSGETEDKKDQSAEVDSKETTEKQDETEEAKSEEDKPAESQETSAEEIDELAGETNATEASIEETDEDELTKEFIIPEVRRPRDQLIELLHLDEESTVNELALAKAADTTLRELKRLYDSAIKPLEILYKYRDLSNRHFGDPEIFSKPLILFMGPWSGGKSSIINYLLDNEYNENSLRTGAEPSPAYFNIVTWGPEPEILDGTQLAADWTFSGLQKFGQGLEDRLRGLKLPNKLLEKVNIVEIPGILEVRKQVSRVFPFNDACQWFIDRADIIFLVYDPSKLDVGPETEAILDQLKGREYQTRVILNKADTVKPEELLRVQGALLWNISPLMSSAQPPIIYTTSLWSTPFNPGSPVKLLQAQERAFLRDIRQAIDKRVENKIASARRFAVRVRNHAKMVDCYLTTYYNHKTFFGNRKQIADDIIENPQQYHIYEGLSTLKNISRYDLPDPDSYKDFFRLNPLYDFQQLSSTCTYFKGCPINRLDVCIAYDLPELVGKHKKLVEQSLGKNQLNS